MTLSKIVVSGKVTTNPEKRFTQNNMPILSFAMDINPQDETVVRVVRLGSQAEALADIIAKDDFVIVEGRPQIEVVKGTNGKDKRVVEINASTIEKVGSNSGPASFTQTKSDEIVQFASEEVTENLIDEDEIPF